MANTGGDSLGFGRPGARAVPRLFPAVIPDVEELLQTAVVVRLPMRTRFRGLTARETMVFAGPAGWGEFGPFIEYDDAEAASWLRAGVEAAYLGPPDPVRETVPVNATVPAVPADEVAGLLRRYPGAGTAKVKVAEPGQTLDDDVARVAATREVIGRVRIDANGGWTVDEAIAAIRAIGDVEYAEQPCRTVEELAAVRRAVGVPIAADESIRKADDPFRVVAAEAADVAVVKVAPLGGMRATLELADGLGLDIVVSSALDSAVGIAAGVATAAALPRLDLACGLGTGSLFTADVAPPFLMHDGVVEPRWFGPGRALDVAAHAAPPDRQRWWRERLRRCHRLLRN
ncbi:o-succinylbenzoate synthase [Gordonia jinghuaiqii]|uniref:o-succinylbenzoate synthase n=1 Tax=Gordonia jinghuaiqii TaxID=2758710 RepID=A0A7D7LQG3_9ACTN|nr:o-succinylbenzoate synthase [Gordonia jinghuaiqii]MCR5979435.1 o-succinylbenzoate synthase [Gordonia jinghuaiqii]MCR5979856.1 o-succinylbenzoate synthase [Gordonia jinghuaiqii]QMT00760.1 o-succinylbenzoate synthase [Gordonia jinghuaiqii]